MAINPNTDFTTGAVLTAAQQNRFPRGVMAYGEATGDFGITTTEAVSITAVTFTAVANRYYKITYFEPALGAPAGAGNFSQTRIRLNNATGTQYALGQYQASGATASSVSITTMAIETFSAGSVTIAATAVCNTGTATAFRGATLPAFLLIEDIGPS